MTRSAAGMNPASAASKAVGAAAAVGADLGGTWVRAVIIRRGGSTSRVKERLDGRQPAQALRALLRHCGIRRAEALVVGAKGAGGAPAPAHWRRALAPLARKVLVTGDLELARDAAFAGGPGVLLIAGTGSAALARGDDGVMARAGGRGPLLGDEGSAFWLGRRWLKTRGDAEALSYARRPDAVAAVAALAPGILRRARLGRALERSLAAAAAEALAALARRAARGRFRGPIPLCVHGGLASERWFAALLGRRLGSRFSARPPRWSPQEWAARRAAEFVSWP